MYPQFQLFEKYFKLENFQEAFLHLENSLYHHFEYTIKKCLSKNYFKSYVFWQSDLPLTFFEKLFFENQDSEEILNCYFYQVKGKTVRIDILSKIADINPKIIGTTIRKNQIFLKEDWLEQFGFLEHHPDNDLNVLFLICQKMAEIYKHYLAKKEEAADILSKFSWLDLMIHLSLYAEKKRFEDLKGDFLDILRTPYSYIVRDKLIMHPDKKEKIPEEMKCLSRYVDILKDETEIQKQEQHIESYVQWYRFEQDILFAFCYDNNTSPCLRKDNVMILKYKELKKLFE